MGELKRLGPGERGTPLAGELTQMDNHRKSGGTEHMRPHLNGRAKKARKTWTLRGEGGFTRDKTLRFRQKKWV